MLHKKETKKKEVKGKKALTVIENGTDTLNTAIKLHPEGSMHNGFFFKGHSPWASSWHRSAMAKALYRVVLVALLGFSTMLNAGTQLHMAVQGWLDFPPPSTEASVSGGWGRWGWGWGEVLESPLLDPGQSA